MHPSIVRRVDRGHVLMSDGCVARAPAPVSHAPAPRHSLEDNGLNDQAKQAVKDAAGSGVSIALGSGVSIASGAFDEQAIEQDLEGFDEKDLEGFDENESESHSESGSALGKAVVAMGEAVAMLQDMLPAVLALGSEERLLDTLGATVVCGNGSFRAYDLIHRLVTDGLLQSSHTELALRVEERVSIMRTLPAASILG